MVPLVHLHVPVHVWSLNLSIREYITCRKTILNVTGRTINWYFDARETFLKNCRLHLCHFAISGREDSLTLCCDLRQGRCGQTPPQQKGWPDHTWRGKYRAPSHLSSINLWISQRCGPALFLFHHHGANSKTISDWSLIWDTVPQLDCEWSSYTELIDISILFVPKHVFSLLSCMDRRVNNVNLMPAPSFISGSSEIDGFPSRFCFLRHWISDGNIV